MFYVQKKVEKESTKKVYLKRGTIHTAIFDGKPRSFKCVVANKHTAILEMTEAKRDITFNKYDVVALNSPRLSSVEDELFIANGMLDGVETVCSVKIELLKQDAYGFYTQVSVVEFGFERLPVIVGDVFKSSKRSREIKIVHVCCDGSLVYEYHNGIKNVSGIMSPNDMAHVGYDGLELGK